MLTFPRVERVNNGKKSGCVTVLYNQQLTTYEKGRVERANQTLQDRLVKELRLRGISDIDTANAFLPVFIEDYNQRFAVAPHNPNDAHLPVLHSDRERPAQRPGTGADPLCLHHTRTLSKNMSCQFNNRQYQVQPRGQGLYPAQGGHYLYEAFDGTVTLLYKARALRYHLLREGELPAPLADEKSVAVQAKADQAGRHRWKPAPDHPWRRSCVVSAPRCR